MTEREPPAAVVHVDLDGGRDVFAAHGWAWRLSDDPLFATGLAGALDLFDAEGVRATFFAVARDLHDPQKRPLLEEVVRRGHAVGSHSRTHRLLTRLPREDKRREIADSRAELAAELGTSVDVFRAPGFAVDRESLELVAEAGYRADSSLFPTAACARRAGLERIPAGVHRPLAESELLELPMPAHAPLPLPFHPSYALVLGVAWFRVGLALARRRGEPLVLLFHLTDFAEPLPADALPGRRARLWTLSHRSAEKKRAACARMLARVRASYRLVPTLP